MKTHDATEAVWVASSLFEQKRGVAVARAVVEEPRLSEAEDSSNPPKGSLNPPKDSLNPSASSFSCSKRSLEDPKEAAIAREGSLRAPEEALVQGKERSDAVKEGGIRAKDTFGADQDSST